MRIPVLFMTLLAATVLASCGGRGGDAKVDTTGATQVQTAPESAGNGAKVESITLAKDDGSGAPGETASSFAPSDRKFHAAITLDEGGAGKVRADLIAVDTPEGKDIKVLTQDYTLSGIENTVKVAFSLPQDWPVGSYRIDAYVNDKLSKSKEFMIQ